MRTGAIFARGSCRALKWLALFGVLFSLGAGSAAAQTGVTVSLDKVEIVHAAGTTETVRLGEGVETMIRITLDKPVPSGTDAMGNDLAVVTTVNGRISLTGFVARDDDDAESAAGQAEESEDVSIAGRVVLSNNADAFFSIREGRMFAEVPLETLNDLDAVDEEFTVGVTLLTVDNPGNTQGTRVSVDSTPLEIDVAIVDDEQQDYWFDIVGGPSAATEAGEFMVNFYADPPRPPADSVHFYVRLDSDHGDVLTSNPADGHQISAADGNVELTITPNPEGDGNRTDDDVTLTASMFDSNTGLATDVEVKGASTITILDVHHLPVADDISAELMDEDGDEIDPAMIAEGETAFLEVTLKNEVGGRVNDTEVFTIDVMAPDANRSDLAITRLMPVDGEVTGAGMRTVRFEIEALPDDDISIDSSGMAIPEEIALVLDVAGHDDQGGGNVDPPAMFTVSIEDMTDAQVEVAEGAYDHIMSAMPNPLNPGGMFSLETAMLFMFDEAMFDVSYGASVDGDGGVLAVSTSGGMVNIEAMGAGSAMVTVTATARPRASSFVVTQTVDNVAQVTFPVDVVLEDLSVTVMAEPMEIMEGESVMLTATANRAVTEDTMIMLTVVGDEDAYMVADAIMIADGAMSGSVELMATEDDDYMNETLTVIATGPGISGLMEVEVMVMDNDMAPTTVSAKSQEQVDAVFAIAIADARSGSDWTTGDGAAMVDMSMLFDMAEGAMPTYSGMSSDDMVVSASSSGAMLSLMPMGGGMATITVTATDAASGDVAMVMSDVMVMLEGLTYTVMADETNLVEGMEHENGTKTSAMVTVMASRALVGDETAEIMLMRDAASSASMDDYTVMPEMVTLMAGEMEATFTVMAVEDNMTEGGAGMPEMLTLFVSLNGMQMTDKSVMFYLWDHAVPALPIIAQLLLAAFLAIGGYRRYLRRR